VGEAAAAAERIGEPVALKILSRDILHKSDIGGVILNLEGAAKVRSAAGAMLERLEHMQPRPLIDGLLIQSMVKRPNAHSLLVGMTSDPTFGPVIVFGHGGTAVEVIADRAIGLPPLNMKLAREMMERTRIIRLLKGYRNKPAADCEAIAFTMLKISQMIIDNPEISEIDINPLFADQNGVIAVDARIRIAAATGPAEHRLAIKPYPAELETAIVLSDGRQVLLRPIVPEDAASLSKLIKRLELSAGEQKLFTHGALKSLQAPRSTQIDYDRQMAFVAFNPAQSTIMEGLVAIDADPDNEKALLTLAVKDEVLGMLLLHSMIAFARRRGIGTLLGDAHRPNARLITLCDKLGFAQSDIPGEPDAIRLSLRYQ
jgi:acetyltransferase